MIRKVHIYKVLIICFSLFSLTARSQVSFFLDNMKSYNEHSPQERVFIDYDRSKDYYPGDTVFFSAKVVRTDNMKASDYSGVLYVELLNGNNVKVDMQKLLLEDGVAKGRLVVDATYGSGFYYYDCIYKHHEISI